MEKTEPKFQDDWQLEKSLDGERLYDIDDQPPVGSMAVDDRADNPGIIRQVAVAGLVLVITVAVVVFLILDRVIGPMQNESREIKEMISELQGFRRNDMGTLEARLDEQARISGKLLRQVSALRRSQAVVNEPSSALSRAREKPPTTKYSLYRIKKNETLGEIAKKHKVSVKRILEENEIKNRHKIVAGQEIYIPSR
uniref:LysM domain-containing protein n=1 Tax=Candidatus Kentrum sp. SD TaxID=2126332 RepID=A0A450YJS3_9GAMM|nr:MAG: LysM domain-containing protein [Candidatus Kentron sp. SD]VFK49115.1 MAG: LysM domain-containing protein [Candidatus Kentron sp. SD]VFK80123.1 MAG: LysM domain-containing protein [Candidatus Kentron sp. SD]